MTTNYKRKKCQKEFIVLTVIVLALAALLVLLPSPYTFIILIALMNIAAFFLGVVLVRDENKRIIRHLEEDWQKTYLGLDILALTNERDAIQKEIECTKAHALKCNEAFELFKEDISKVKEGFDCFISEAKRTVNSVVEAEGSWNHYVEDTVKTNEEMLESAAKAKEEFLTLSESNAALKYENEGLEQKIEEKKALLKQDHIMVFNTPYYPSTFLSKHVHETYLPKYAKSVLGDKFLQVGNIVELSEDCFARIPGVGDQTIMAVKKLLAQHDLYLGCSDIICINGQWYTKG